MNYGQSKFASFIEACANTAVGLIFSYTIQIVLIHAYGVEMSNTTAAHFVFWFTIASVFRSYVIRRIGNLPYWARIRERRRKAKLARECAERGHLPISSITGHTYCEHCEDLLHTDPKAVEEFERDPFSIEPTVTLIKQKEGERTIVLKNCFADEQQIQEFLNSERGERLVMDIINGKRIN